jgi:hypothetical protein
MRPSSITGKTFELFEMKKGSTTKKLSARVTYNATSTTFVNKGTRKGRSSYAPALLARLVPTT